MESLILMISRISRADYLRNKNHRSGTKRYRSYTVKRFRIGMLGKITEEKWH